MLFPSGGWKAKLFIWVWRVYHPLKENFVHLAAIRWLWPQNHEGKVSSLACARVSLPYLLSLHTKEHGIGTGYHGKCSQHVSYAENIIVLSKIVHAHTNVDYIHTYDKEIT